MRIFTLFSILTLLILAGQASARSMVYKDNIYNPGRLKPIDSVLKVKVGDPAPDFELDTLAGKKVRLSDFRDKKNVMITFIPAAWTPVCSDQWPGYNIAKELFDQQNTAIIGISVDNIPTLHAWTLQMGDLWFDVASDFYPHGKVSDTYGVLRSDGTAERAIIIIDKKGIIRFAHVEDINVRPELGMIINALKKINQ